MHDSWSLTSSPLSIDPGKPLIPNDGATLRVQMQGYSTKATPPPNIIHTNLQLRKRWLSPLARCPSGLGCIL